MSDTEVTVTKSNSGEWYRMEYKGKVEFCDEAPTPSECADFRRSTDQMLRQARIESIVAKRINGHESTMREEEFKR